MIISIVEGIALMQMKKICLLKIEIYIARQPINSLQTPNSV